MQLYTHANKMLGFSKNSKHNLMLLQGMMRIGDYRMHACDFTVCYLVQKVISNLPVCDNFKRGGGIEFWCDLDQFGVWSKREHLIR
jgi:hypothetical protein